MIKIILQGSEARQYAFKESMYDKKIKELEDTIESLEKTVSKVLSEKYGYVSSFVAIGSVVTSYQFKGDESELLKENKELRAELLNLKNKSLIQRILNK